MMELSSEEDEPLLKTTQTPSTEYNLAWHPVKFDYKIIHSQQRQKLSIVRHESLVTFVLTKPNGFVNKSFAQSPTIQKLYERMEEEVWQNQKT